MRFKFIILLALVACLAIGVMPASAMADDGGAGGGFSDAVLPLTPEQMVTARLTLWRCFRYEPLIDRWNAEFQLSKNLVIAVMAKESSCFPDADDGTSVGLMAITPRSWLFPREELIKPDINIYTGMFMLFNILQQSDGDVRDALGAYNCGWVSLNAGKCIGGGGYAYADDILNTWLPLAKRYADRGWDGFLPNLMP